MSVTTNSTLISSPDNRTNFYEKVEKYIKSLNYKYQEKTVITETMKDRILRCLSNKYPEEFDSRFKSWCRTSFSIRKIGSQFILCDSKKQKPILIYEQMYQIFKQIHEETAHGGRDKCMDGLSVNYSWYNRQLLQLFINNCQACQNRQAVKIPIISKPIIELAESIISTKIENNDTQELPFTLITTKTTTTDESTHVLIRKAAHDNYLKSQHKRQTEYDKHLEKIADSYKNGDIVGIAINKVDRTNCDPKIMPCMIEKRSDNPDIPMYHLISPYGRLSISFPVHQLIPMSGIQPAILKTAKFKNSGTVTLVQASKLFARGNPCATCDCKTKCRTKTCPCRRASIACSTKCHARLGKCTNVDEQTP